MSEFSKSSTVKFSGDVLSDFVVLCSFILSHPLYFSYFIFFSPYLLKLLSFLSPLFVTTSLLLLAFLTLSPNLGHESFDSKLAESKTSFLVCTYNNICEKLQSEAENETEEFNQLEEFELYKIVFDVSMNEGCPDEVLEVNCVEKYIQAIEATVDECSRNSGTAIESNEKPYAVSEPFVKEMLLEDFWQEKSNFDYLLCDKDGKEAKPAGDESNKVEVPKDKLSSLCGSKVIDSEISDALAKVSSESSDNDEGLTSKAIENSQRQEASLLHGSDNVGNCNSKIVKNCSRRLGANAVSNVYDDESDMTENEPLSPNLGSFGSMRKEKEWRRTLACKLFEERHNVHVDGTEGMDLLWETYENTEPMKVKAKTNIKKVKSYDTEEDEDEDEETDAQLCCLQALKFSAGKMNLGMGRPNLARISKAFKGIGWLHHMGRRSKKVYH